jgi:hypothetical protein
VVPADADAIAGAVTALLADAGERFRLGQIGRDRIGLPGAINHILEEIV